MKTENVMIWCGLGKCPVSECRLDGSEMKGQGLSSLSSLLLSYQATKRGISSGMVGSGGWVRW